jgi:hypothetical protein
MLNFIGIYIFIPVSGCVGSGPSALLFLGAYNGAPMDAHGRLTWGPYARGATARHAHAL